MAKKYFIPQVIAQLKLWLNTYKTKIATHGATIGLTAGEITAQQADCDAMITKINDADIAKQAQQASVNTQNQTIKIKLPNITNMAKRVKTHAGYTGAIGEELGIVGDEHVFDPATYQTVLKLRMDGGTIRIDFTRIDVEGINIYTRLQGQANWNFLARDTSSPYHDTRPLSQAGVAETREYMAFGVVNDTQIGLQSAMVSIVYGG